MRVVTRLATACAWFSSALCAPAIGQTPGAATVLSAPTTANAVDELVARYQYIINFEGPHYTYEGDFEDIPDPRRKPGAPIERRIKPNPVTLSVPAGPITRDQMAGILGQLVDLANEGDGARFRLEERGDTFNVIATEVRDARGKWTRQPSLFDVRIAIPKRDRSAYDLLNAILMAVGAANHTTLVLYDHRPGPLAAFEKIRTAQSASDEMARDVLARTLALANRRFAWRSAYDRVTDKYYLTILLVGSKAAASGIAAPTP